MIINNLHTSLEFHIWKDCAGDYNCALEIENSKFITLEANTFRDAILKACIQLEDEIREEVQKEFRNAN